MNEPNDAADDDGARRENTKHTANGWKWVKNNEKTSK